MTNFKNRRYVKLVNNLLINIQLYDCLKVCLKIQSPKTMVNCTKIGGRLSAIRTASRLEGLADNAQGRSSSCPCGLPGLEEDSYLKLRSGVLREFKSMSALFQQLSAGPGSRTSTLIG